MQGIIPCLIFEDRAEEAIDLYVSVIPNSRILSKTRSDGSGLVPEGRILHARFELDGREFAAGDGGPSFSFSEAFSLMATCDTQEELDAVWAKLTEGGGEGGRCGWLKDRFGMSWQVVPSALGRMMGDAESGSPAKVMEALLQMGKIDIATLERAYRQEIGSEAPR